METQQKQIPKILYKYRALDHHGTSMLSKGELYFATTNELKDRLEKTFRFKNGAWIKNEKNELIYLTAEQYTQYFLSAVRNEKKTNPLGFYPFVKAKGKYGCIPFTLENEVFQEQLPSAFETFFNRKTSKYNEYSCDFPQSERSNCW